MQRCPKCNRDFPETYKFCKLCGGELTSALAAPAAGQPRKRRRAAVITLSILAGIALAVVTFFYFSSKWRIGGGPETSFQEKLLAIIPQDFSEPPPPDSWWPVFSSDGKKVAYKAKQGNKQFVVLENNKGPEFDKVWCVALSADGSKLAYAAMEEGLIGSKCFVVVNGKKGPEFDDVGAVVVSQDGTTVAYHAQKGTKQFIVVNGKEGPEFDRVMGIALTADGSKVAYGAKQDGESFVVVGDKKVQGFDEVGVPVFSPDGRLMACPVKRGGKWFIMVGDKTGPKCAFVGPPVFSPDGTKLAYVAVQPPGRYYLMVGDRRVAEGLSSTRYPPLFSADGKKLVHVEWAENRLDVVVKDITSDTTRTVAFVQGHGEKDPGVGSQGGYADARKGLEEEGYSVISLKLDARVPDTVKTLLVAGPKTEPSPKELEFLSEFMNRGGGLLVMVDPSPSASLEAFLKGWQVTPANDIVLDVSGAGRLVGAGPTAPLVTQYESYAYKLGAITTPQQITFFPLARSLTPSKEAVNGVTVVPLFKSMANSWGETDLKGTEATFDERSDIKGPLSLAVAVTKDVQPVPGKGWIAETRMIVVGNSQFAAVPNFQMQGNGKLFLDMVHWLAEDRSWFPLSEKQQIWQAPVLSLDGSKLAYGAFHGRELWWRVMDIR